MMKKGDKLEEQTYYAVSKLPNNSKNLKTFGKINLVAPTTKFCRKIVVRWQ